MKVLGLNAYHGDASSALFDGGVLRAAVEEERFNRTKHWAGLPVEAVRSCLQQTGIDRIDHIAVSRDPSAHFWTKVRRVASRPGLWAHAIGRSRNLISVRDLPSKLVTAGIEAARGAQFHSVEHHRAHLASAFFASPFEDAAIISIDGFGDFSSAMWGTGTGNKIEILESVTYPHSLGLFYTAFTQFLGFPNYGDEYKMMGLSAYGVPRFVNEVRDVVSTSGGAIRLNLAYFRHDSEGVEMTWSGGKPVLGNVYSQKLVDKFGTPRVPRSEITQRDMDLAASVQKVLEENYFELLRHVSKVTGKKAVCLAGGVSLNCVANGMVFKQTDFRDLYIQPAAHDAGTSIGAALYVQHQVLSLPRSFEMKHVYYGPGYDDDAIKQTLDSAGVTYHALSEAELIDRTAAQIADGKIVGWYQGAMEFGPRALGNRSILADPRRADMKETLNSRIKYREPFRPFCPSVLAEAVGDYFECDYPAPFMVSAYMIKPEKRSVIPAVTHGDGTGRLQTVEKDVNPRYWGLINRFGQITGVPVVLNTSFNENEPIVDTPVQALDCFLRTRMDVLAAGNFLLLKTENQQQSENRKSFAEAALGAAK